LLIDLFEDNILNRALIYELLKYRNDNEDIYERMRSIFLFFDRICVIILILRIIKLTPNQNSNKQLEIWIGFNL
jgi:hypothetical protein